MGTSQKLKFSLFLVCLYHFQLNFKIWSFYCFQLTVSVTQSISKLLTHQKAAVLLFVWQIEVNNFSFSLRLALTSSFIYFRWLLDFVHKRSISSTWILVSLDKFILELDLWRYPLNPMVSEGFAKKRFPWKYCLWKTKITQNLIVFWIWGRNNITILLVHAAALIILSLFQAFNICLTYFLHLGSQARGVHKFGNSSMTPPSTTTQYSSWLSRDFTTFLSTS